MDNLQKLKQDMLDANKAYKDFQIKNSRALTKDETINLDMPSFGSPSIQQEPTMLELTQEKMEEMKNLEFKMKEAYYNYINEYNKIKRGSLNK